jgi:DNA mismatch endonuclease (patch repair protein)
MDIMSPLKRSQLMARICSKNTSPERIITALLMAGGLSFEQHCRDLPGCPDIVFRKQRVAVFVDGDFWHGWRFPIWRHRMSDKWSRKIDETRKRDKRVHCRLRKRGWKVIRIWEHSVEENRLECIRRVLHLLPFRAFDWKCIANTDAALPKMTRRNRLPRAKPAV